MVKNPGIKHRPTSEAGIWNIRSWPKIFHNYSKYLPILIKSIFHYNTQITKNLFSNNLFRYMSS